MCGLSEHGRLRPGEEKGVGGRCGRGSMTLDPPLPLHLLLPGSLEESSCWGPELTDHVLPLSDKHLCTPSPAGSCVKVRRERNK